MATDLVNYQQNNVRDPVLSSLKQNVSEFQKSHLNMTTLKRGKEWQEDYLN